jgi:RecJ-like exonuclease
MSLLLPCPGCGEDRKADEGHAICRACEGYGPRPDPRPGQTFDASNSVRLCDRCNDEQGAGAADPGDMACAACGFREAPHIYVPASSPLPAGGLSEEEVAAAVNAIRRCEACEGEGNDSGGWHDCKVCNGNGFTLPPVLARLVSAPNPNEGENGGAS